MIEIYKLLNWDKFVQNAHPLLREMFSAEEQWVSKLKNVSILEIGCGTGRLIKLMNIRENFVVGIDIELGVLNKSAHENSRENIFFSQQNGACLALKSNQFDHVICMGNTFGNLHPKHNDVLKEMLRVCKPGGTITLGIYNEHALEARLASYKNDELHQTKVTIDGTVYIQEGIISEQFSKSKITKILTHAGIRKFLINNLSKIGYLVQFQRPLSFQQKLNMLFGF